MPDLVRSELADPRQREHDRVVRQAGAALGGPRQTLEEQPVLPHPQRAGGHRRHGATCGGRGIRYGCSITAFATLGDGCIGNGQCTTTDQCNQK